MVTFQLSYLLLFNSSLHRRVLFVILFLFPEICPDVLLSLWDPYSLRCAAVLPLVDSQPPISRHVGPAAVADLKTHV